MNKILNKIKSFIKSDIVKRVFWTFIEGFLGGFSVTLSTTQTYNGAILKSACIGGLAAAISAVKTLIANYLSKRKVEVI